MVEKKLHIAILGTRGIPNRYGGFEQCAEYLSVGLVARGHKVTVYNVDHHDYQEKNYKGVEIIHCKDWEPKLGTAGQFFYDLNCTLHARKQKYDVVLQLGYTSSSVWYWLWSSKQKHVVNMDGLEHKRSKFNGKVQAFLRKAEAWAIQGADALVADNKGIQAYLKKTHQADSYCIAYGAERMATPSESMLEAYHLTPRNYDLVIARMEPENNIKMILDAYLLSDRKRELVLIGKTDTPKGKEWVAKYGHEKGIRFLGGIYDQEKIHALRYFSMVYYHGHSVGGTNPSLLEAMASECFIVAYDVSFNRYVLENAAYYFSTSNEIVGYMNLLHPYEETTGKRALVLEKIQQAYHWDKIISEYENVLLTICE